jgi:membrane-bound PQQ-dependent dehydrogenase (glucose/quinate/shikimate family)
VPNYALGTSPPTMIGGLAVVGHMIMDNQGRFSPSGVVRAYDAITGKVRWAWDIGRPGQTDPLPPGENYTANTPNAWSVFAADEALGLVYIPTGGAPPDYFGGMRTPEDDKFGSSITALDAKTGQVKWSFQAVHHDIWDYDIGSQPTLVDFPTENGPVPALIQPTKTGQLFVFDRRDGKPLVDIEERPAPKGGVPEEHVAPTQPYAVGMPDMGGGPDLTENDTWGISPIDRVMCSIQFHNSVYGGRYTPTSLKPSLLFPGYSGGMDWGGVAVDTDRNVMIVNTIRVANRNWLVTRKEADESGVKPLGPGVIFPSVFPATQEGTPYGAHALSWFSVLRMPCHAPPWGTISGIDLKTRKVIWTRPFGTARDSGPFGIRSHIPLPTGVPNQGGAVVTAGGLTFIAATLDNYLRAYDTETGKELWRTRLPAGAQASPISYMQGGRQYVVIFAGGHANLRTPFGDYVLAFALPETAK